MSMLFQRELSASQQQLHIERNKVGMTTVDAAHLCRGRFTAKNKMGLTMEENKPIY